ncbi:MAG: nitroreductase family protein [Thermoanaerobaculia bacterium]|nr:nitroreductase family protein [Thermoanaerobaculia bacterium]
MNVLDREAGEHRQTTYPIDDIFLERWSPRAMRGEPIEEEELLRLFEAARWAPSSYNGQPWRFVYALRGGEGWDRLYDLLVDFNQQWAEQAGALVVVLSRRTFEHNGEPSRTHSFDTGAAWQNLALQGHSAGLVVHAMEGFDYDEARRVLELDDDMEVEAMVAIGKPGEIEALPGDLEERETPSDRKPLDEIVQRI